MSRKNELLISGVRMSPDEEAEMQSLVNADEIEVFQMETKSAGLSDMVQVVFHDFSPIGYVRDMAIGFALQKIHDKVKPVVLRFLTRGHTVRAVCIEKDMVTEDGVRFLLYVVTDAEHFEQLLKELDAVKWERLLPKKQNDVVVAHYDNYGNIDINILGH